MIGIQLCNRLYAKLFYCYIAILLEQLDSIILLLRYFVTSLLRYFVTSLPRYILQSCKPVAHFLQEIIGELSQYPAALYQVSVDGFAAFKGRHGGILYKMSSLLFSLMARVAEGLKSLTFKFRLTNML